ncbi:MAG: hypothetical protein NZZ60_03665 [Bacteroidia bacterium]|nr:hypothetical protein [Bacteroidia bacterium]MCX7652518.1 hypothetical protein [Bacteroidia bacterium]MDW8417632.1 hypothetical protein [Bacteroidia bacterium]
MWVMKVGGGCLRDAAGIRQLPRVLNSAYGESSRLLVVSAIGKTTNRLLQIAEAAGRSDLGLADALLTKLRDDHQAIIHELLPDGSAHQLMHRLNEKYWTALWQRVQALSHLSEEIGYATDAILVYGELISSEIVKAYLEAQGFSLAWVDARRLIVTDGYHPEPTVIQSASQANVDAQLVPLFRTHKLVLTQGYIASDLRRRSVTLGREGSDYSAALFANMLGAQGMIAWKDVGRLYSADPNIYSDAQPLTELSYSQAAEITYYGAQILHPRTLRPLRERRIPLYVRPYFDPAGEGTIIAEKWVYPLPPIRTQRRGLILIEVESTDLSPLSLTEMLRDMENEGIEAYFVQGGVRTAAFAVKGSQDSLERWRAAIPAGWEVSVRQPVTLYTILYPDATLSSPNGEAIYFQRLPDRVHWLAYEG